MQQQRVEDTAEKISVFLEGIANTNSKLLANELFENRNRAITLRLKSIVHIKGISYATVLDDRAKIVAESGIPAKGQKFSKQELPLVASNQISEGTLSFITPIRAYDELFGYVVIQYPLQDLQKEEFLKFVLFTVGFFVLMLISLFFVNTLIRKNVVDPINNLVRTMRAVQEGQFDKQIDIVGSNEMRELSLTFNSMTEEISSSYLQLEKAGNFIEQIIDTIDSVLIAIDGNYQVTTWNRSACLYTGISHEEAIGKDLYIIFPTLISFRGNIESSVQNSSPDLLHRTFINKTCFNIFIYPLNDTDLQGALIRLDDITEFEERESQLRQSQKMETVGLIAGGVAHDFNNMLSGILGAAQLLSAITDESKPQSYIKMIINAAQRAAELTAKLLAFSRKSKLELQPFDCHDALYAAVDILRRSIDKNISIRMELNASRSIIAGDLTELQNCFLNLGINSSHAMLSGGDILFSSTTIELDSTHEVAAIYHLSPGTFIQIDVTDSGVGISANSINSIFEPFYTTKDQGKGTGLGLAAVYGTIKQLNGAVTVDSVEGQGTVFHLFFPLSNRKPIELDKKIMLPVRGQGKLMVVDDEEVVRQTTKGLLELLGYEVMTAIDGKSALEIFRQEHSIIELVILDMIMPQMGGLECYKALKMIDSGVKVVISSGFTRGDDLHILKQMGIAGSIRKPFDQEELSRVIAMAMN